MRVFLRALGALAFVGFASGAACSLLVASEYSGYSLATDSGVCSLRNDAGTQCATCITSNCQNQLNNHCGASILESVAECAADPSPGGGLGGCNQFFDAAFSPEEKDNYYDLRTCIASTCQGPFDCTACTEIDAGPSACGSCIMSKCGQLLSGLTGCCGEPTVQNWVSDCVFAQASTTCTVLNQQIASNYGDGGARPTPGTLPADGGDCVTDFGLCVYTNCGIGSSGSHPCN